MPLPDAGASAAGSPADTPGVGSEHLGTTNRPLRLGNGEWAGEVAGDG